MGYYSGNGYSYVNVLFFPEIGAKDRYVSPISDCEGESGRIKMESLDHLPYIGEELKRGP